MDRPETRFAWNGDVSLAYQVCGDGSTDLVYLQGYCSNVDVNWESPSLSRFLRGLASYTRLIVTDRRGWGCSERFTPGSVPDVDTLTDDVRWPRAARADVESPNFGFWARPYLAADA
jgi:pimeloyl-ACP methyl ester carboxylesterase